MKNRYIRKAALMIVRKPLILMEWRTRLQHQRIFGANQKASGEGQEIFGAAPEENCSVRTVCFGTDDGKNTSLANEIRRVVANEEEGSSSEKKESESSGTFDNGVYYTKQGMSFRDLTEDDSEVTNFRTSKFQVVMQTAREAHIRDPGIRAKRNVGINAKSNMSANSQKQGAAALTVLTGDSVIKKKAW